MSRAVPDPIQWRLHTNSPSQSVFRMLDTDSGRAAFWAESAVQHQGMIHFEFINGMTYDAAILERQAGRLWKIDYFDSTVQFLLDQADDGGTDITLTNTGVAEQDRCEVSAGWLNVLLPLKAAVDHGVDLRTHDPSRTWDLGFVDQ